MKKILTIAILVASLASHGQIKHDASKHVILPNPKLLGCVSSDCSLLLLGRPPDANDIYPKQVTVDLLDRTHCASGVMARYDKSVSIDNLKASIDEQYGRWALPQNDTSPVKLWRVEPEKFSIQLGAADKRIAKAFRVEVGMKTVIYMAFRPRIGCGS